MAVVLSLAGIAGSALWATTLGRNDADQSRAAFRLESEQIAANAQLAIQHQEDLLRYAGAFVLENPRATNTAWTQWISDSRLWAGDPELLGIGKIILVRRAALAAYAAQAQRATPGSLGSFSLTPPGTRPYYCFSTFEATPLLSGSLLPPGLDLCAPHENLLPEIADSGQSVLYTADQLGLKGISISAPVYRGGTVPPTIAARRAALAGWVGLLASPQIILSAALAGHPHTAAVLYPNVSSGPNFPALRLAVGRAPRGAQRTTIDLHDGVSVQILAALPSGSLLANGNALAALLFGSLFSLLVALLVVVLATSRARALRLVSEKTQQLSFQAMHDALTGLPNRALLVDRAAQMLARARRQQSHVAALFIDVDGFKRVNDTYGHAAGDELLRVVAARLSSVIRASDTVGRLGGDEFVALIDGDEANGVPPQLVAERVLELLRQPFPLTTANGVAVSISASIGIALGQTCNADELLRDADVALYRAKEAGKDRYVLFQESMQLQAAERRALETDLAQALAHDRLFLLYQPTFDLRTQLVTGVEALLRWQHPTRGIVPPDAFIPIAEDNGLIVPIGAWVLRTACEQAATWSAAGHDIQMSVNVSARQLERDEFVDEVRDALANSGLDAERLTLEVTETVLMRDAAAAAARLVALKALGVRIAIDDFGVGYSSLAYLRQFPVDALKIDRSFITEIASSPEAATMMHTLVQLGKTLGLETLGEGIEEPAQLKELQREQCDSGQGFLFARPLGVEAIEQFLERQDSQTTATDRP